MMFSNHRGRPRVYKGKPCELAGIYLEPGLVIHLKSVPGTSRYVMVVGDEAVSLSPREQEVLLRELQ